MNQPEQDKLVEIRADFKPEMLYEALTVLAEVAGFLGGPGTHVDERMAEQNDLLDQCGDLLIRAGWL